MNRFKVVYDAILDSGAVHTQQEFADATDISRTVISQLLNEKRELNEKQIRRICAAFSFVRADWLREGVGDIFTMALPVMPSASEIEDRIAYDEERAADEQLEIERLKDLERRARLYDSKAIEVQDMYSKLQDMLTRLQEKDKEVQALNDIIKSQAQTIRQLRVQIAGLKNGSDQALDPSLSSDENT